MPIGALLAGLGSAASGLVGSGKVKNFLGNVFNRKKNQDKQDFVQSGSQGNFVSSGGSLSALRNRLNIDRQKQNASRLNFGGGVTFGNESKKNLWLPFALLAGVVVLVLGVFRK